MVKPVKEINLDITQGSSFQGLTIKVPGDRTADLPFGQIVNDYSDRSSVVDWDFEPLVYDEADDQTIVRPILSAATTWSLNPNLSIHTDIKLSVRQGAIEVQRDEILRANITVYPSATQP